MLALGRLPGYRGGMTRVLTGITPTGSPHIGNYYGMMRPAIAWQDVPGTELFLFVSDLHSFASKHDPELFRQHQHELVLDFLATGVDPERTTFYLQSDVRAHTEMAWYLLCHTSMGLLERAHAYKDKVANGVTPGVGLFTYPVLMAADILLYSIDQVPVGQDQQQHVEIARDIAQRMNFHYNQELFTLPEALIDEHVATVPGTDGRKMSKSYGNTIPLFAPEEGVRKAVMSIQTDSKALGEPLDPRTCPVFAYHVLLENPHLEQLRAQYERGEIGYGGSKQQLFELLWERFRPARERRALLASDPGQVQRILQQGAKKASAIAEVKLAQVRQALGLAAQHAV